MISTIEPKADTIDAPARARAEQLPVVDTDVHHGYRDLSDIAPYLTKLHRERLTDFGLLGGSGLYLNNGGVKGRRADTLVADDPKDEGPIAVDPHRVKEQMLDPCGVEIAILTGAQTYTASAMTDLDYANALCRAFNDYSLDHWIAADSRYRLAMSICTQDPMGAVAEIERIGDRAEIVAIVMPCGAPKPYGHRFYHPIYEACVRHNLTVALHFGGEGIGINPAPTPAGYPTYYAESRCARPPAYQVHLASFIFEGVFERFPALKVAMLEAGFAWVPAYLWRMDADWKGLRYQTPWVNRLPSEYVSDHVFFASQPMDEPATSDALPRLIEWMDGERTLMFASDHPHWDWDNPRDAFTTLSAALRRRILVDNGRAAFPKLGEIAAN